MLLKKKILIIDDRPLFTQVIKYIIETVETKSYPLKLDIARSYADGLEKLNYFENSENSFDIIFLNIDISSDNGYGLISTKSYIKKLKTIDKYIKIILFSNRREFFRIVYIIKNCKPNGFLLECDINLNEVMNFVYNSFDIDNYFSKSICTILNKYKKQYISIDEIDYHILYFLKQGVKTCFIKNYIPRSNSAIEKRKSKLKDLLVLSNPTDEDLVKEAIKIGLLSKFEFCKNHSF